MRSENYSASGSTDIVAARAFAMRMLIDIVGVVVIERARVIGARRFSAMCFGATERVYQRGSRHYKSGGGKQL